MVPAERPVPVNTISAGKIRDNHAADSYRRAADAWEGWFNNEVVPVSIPSGKVIPSS